MKYVWITLLIPFTKARGFSKYTYESSYSDEELFTSSFDSDHLERLKWETRNLFYYGWEKYMTYGFPNDEVKPITCVPLERDPDYTNTVRNDITGGFSATLFDAMDTFIVMDDKEGFHNCIRLVTENYKDFAIDSIVQVFETNIRILGSLLTAHLFAIDERRGFQMNDYNGHLLKLAYDLGKRLIISFKHNDDAYFNNQVLHDLTFNYPRINLLKGPMGVPSEIQSEQCLSGMTSLIVEFAMLSRLTNDPIFEDISKRSIMDLWNQRTKLDLLPMSFNTNSRKFTTPITGVGASIDSFYEYALKYSILFDDDDLFDIWKDSYKALLTHSQDYLGTFLNINVNTGSMATEWIDSLAAFFPGLQVLAGDVSNAIKLHLNYLNLWNHYGGLPERWNLGEFRSQGLFEYLGRPYRDGDLVDGLDLEFTNEILLKNSIGLEWYPLRPEFIESSYHLYQATKDPLFLKIGEEMVKKMRDEFLAPCGFAGVDNIILNLRQDRMESFVLSETLKYLYLLFDQSDHSKMFQSGNTILTTEGHAFWWDDKIAQYEKVNHDVFEGMNKWNESEIAEHSFFQKWLFRGEFNLNKEFVELKNDFYHKKDTLKHIDRMDLQVNKLLNLEDDQYSFGQPLMVDEFTHSAIKRVRKLHIRNVNESLKHSNNIQFDSDYLNLETCELYKKSNEFVTSRILSNNEVYLLSRDYPMTLRTPFYRLEESPLEIEKPFYDKYGPQGATCPASPTTNQWEALIATEDNYSIAQIYRFKGEGLPGSPRNNDLYISELEGFKVRFEELSNGKLDSFGEYVDVNSTFLRLVRLNGLELIKTQRVFVNHESEYLKQSQNFEVVNGQLEVRGMLIENMFTL